MRINFRWKMNSKMGFKIESWVVKWILKLDSGQANEI